jgi:hypothetical protein
MPTDIRLMAFPDDDKGRVETGPIQFGDEDWPGTFIRGDDCFVLRLALQRVYRRMKNAEGLDRIDKLQLKSVIELLDECNINPKVKLEPDWEENL